MVYNFSRDSEYHTQINNKVISAETCNTTSMIMAHRQAEHKPIFAMDGEQPEDCLTSFLLKHPESRERMKYMYPWFVERNIPAYEVHEMLLYARESIKFEYEKLREQKNQSLDKGYSEIDQLEKLIDYYRLPVEKQRELEPADNKALLSDNRIRINYLNRHIAALKTKIDNDISEHLKSIYKDSIIRLYEELDKLQESIIMDNINSIDSLSVYLAQFKNKKQDQEEIIDNIRIRVENLRNVLGDLCDTFDSYDRIIEKQNELITAVLDLEIEAYKGTLFFAPGVEAAEHLTPYFSLGIGYIADEGRFSYGGIIEAGYSPGKDLVNVGMSVLLGVGFGRIEG